MAEHLVAVVQLDPEHRVGQRLNDGAFHLNDVLFAHRLSPPPPASPRWPPGRPALPRPSPYRLGPTCPPALPLQRGEPPDGAGFFAWGGPPSACRHRRPGRSRRPIPCIPHRACRGLCPPGMTPPCPVPTACSTPFTRPRRQGLEQCQDLRLPRPDGDGVFEVSRQAAVGGHHCPVVLQDPYPPVAGVDHR